MNDRTEAERDRLLEYVLPHVMFDGWSRQALKHGAHDAGIAERDIDRLFPAGVKDCVEQFLDRADREMAEALAHRNLAGMRVRERIATAVRLRLETAEPHKEAVRRTLAWLALPGHGGIATRSLYRTCDAIWKAAGDTSTDYNFYTKRGLLAAVYSATLLYWLNDHSGGHGETWAFLDRRIENVMQVPKLTAKLREAAERLSAPLKDLGARCTPRRG